MKLSVIIPSYESDPCLSRCLNSVLESGVNHELQVIVVDSSPVPPTEEFKKKYPQVDFVISKSRLFAGAARNLGFQHSKNDWVSFLDSDCLWSKAWMSAAETLKEKFPDAVAFNGQVHYERPENSLAFALHLMEFHEFLAVKTWHPRFIHSGNLLIRRSFFENIGGFREDIPMCTDFTFSAEIDQVILKNVYFVPELSITHMAHMEEKKKILEKVEKMGFWRGKIENQIPKNLQIQHRTWFQFFRFLMAELFLLAIFYRSLKLGSFRFFRPVVQWGRIYNLAVCWSKGFKKGYAEKYSAPARRRSVV